MSDSVALMLITTIGGFATLVAGNIFAMMRVTQASKAALQETKYTAQIVKAALTPIEQFQKDTTAARESAEERLEEIRGGG